jgi:hypothetical protein
MMKRVIVIILVLLLSSCRLPEEGVPDEVNDPIAPNLYGVDDIELSKNARFDPLDGVTAYDVQDGSLTNSITVEGRVDTNENGTYLIKYRVNDSDGNQLLHLRYITVHYGDEEMINIFPYGEFFNGLDGYGIYEEDGTGDGTFTVVDGVLEIEIHSVEQGIWYRPRLNTDGVQFNQGQLYRIEFAGKADNGRVIQLQVGELINYDPWFDKFDPTVNIFSLTEEWATYSYEFTMYKDTNTNGSILFEFGDVAGDRSLTTIYLDHIKIYKIG